MPEGDSIFRAARALHRALAGATVTHFESVFPRLNRVDEDRPLAGRTIDRVEARGKHLLIWFSPSTSLGAGPSTSLEAGALVLRTHMRMNGSWHIYRAGERWRRSRDDMRIVIRTPEIDAVAFSVPVAELDTPDAIERTDVLRELGPDPLAQDFDADDALRRLQSRGDVEVADALLDQSAIAGIGNIFKSEVLFAARVNPFARVADVGADRLRKAIDVAVKFMRANVGESSAGGIVTYSGLRRPTSSDPSARLWVYGRAGKPCRRCGTPISRRKQGPYVRSTYWCEKCQAG